MAYRLTKLYRFTRASFVNSSVKKLTEEEFETATKFQLGISAEWGVVQWSTNSNPTVSALNSFDVISNKEVES